MDRRMATINESLFRQSEWDDYPMKRDDKHTNKIIQPEFAPLSSEMESLPPGFNFIELDLMTDDSGECAHIAQFLNENSENVFQYSKDFIKWTLVVPGQQRSIVLTVGAGNKKLIGIVCARPVCYRIDGRAIRSFEIGWLCTRKDMRHKRLAAVLMRELYRRIHSAPFPMDVGMIFSVTDRQLPSLHVIGPSHFLFKNIDETIKPNKNINLIRFANRRDLSRMMKLYKSYQPKWRMYREYTQDEFEHAFLKRGDVSTYVVRTDNGDVKDFISMSSLHHSEKGPVAHIHFISFVNEKLLELFVQNILFILSKNDYSGVLIEDVNAVGEVLRTKLDFQDIHTRWYYQFNYNTKLIGLDQTQFTSSMF